MNECENQGGRPQGGQPDSKAGNAMKSTHVDFNLRRWILSGATLLLAASCASAAVEGIGFPLYVGNSTPLQDEFGRPMRGSPMAKAAALRPRVEIRRAYNLPYVPSGIVAPVYANGTVSTSPYNALATETNQFWTTRPEGTVPADSIGGMGMNAAVENSGLFTIVFPKRPATGERLFARVYNAPTLEAATFYADSQAVEIPSATETSIALTFGPMKPLDTADSDGDGLVDSWERLLGTIDRATADYDGDGMSDLHEMLAGTALDDPASKLTFNVVRTEPSSAVRAEGEEPPRAIRVKWKSVPGKKYRLEFVPMLAAIDPATGEPYAFELVEGGEVVAGENEYEIDLLVENVPADLTTAVFRVKLVVPAPY